jgi:hypothetical protein
MNVNETGEVLVKVYAHLERYGWWINDLESLGLSIV